MNRQFGALSGLAMVLIVINHTIAFGIGYPQEWGYPAIAGWARAFLSMIQSFGWFAVPIFFFISGSFVAYAAQGDPPRLSRKFLVSTLRHICIPYIIWSIIFYLLLAVFFHDTFNLLGYIKNLLVGYPYHFVPLLVFYYIISPVLIRISRSHGLILLAIIAIYQILLITTLYPGMLGFTLPSWSGYLTPPVIRSTLAEWGIYFPLGLVYGLNARRVMPWSKKFFWWIAGATILVFILGNLDVLGVIHFPGASYLCPVLLMLLLPAIKREMIPGARMFERIGRRSYGIYLTHLIVINLVLIGINLLLPYLFNFYVILLPVLFLLALIVPLQIMEWSAKGPTKQYYRYVFG